MNIIRSQCEQREPPVLSSVGRGKKKIPSFHATVERWFINRFAQD